MKRSIVLGWTGLSWTTALPVFADARADTKADTSSAEQAVGVGDRANEARPAVAPPPGKCGELPAGGGDLSPQDAS